MKGLEIAKKFYFQYGKPMFESEFSDIYDRLAVGLVGEGSECFGYDDKFSRDHDFEAGFCIWITRNDYEKFGFKLERAYSKLPKEFMGLKRAILSPVGGNRHGVLIIEDFYDKFLGSNFSPNNNKRWLYIPSQTLANATNGEVFYDGLGEFSEIRNQLLKGYPEDVRKKKISAHSVMMAQAGQYNYYRLAKRGETGAAQLAVFEFVKHAISVIYLLNNKYEPFYKWAYKGMRELEILGDLELALVGLTELDNSVSRINEKKDVIEDVSHLLINEFKRQSITQATCNNLEQHALSILDGVKDNELRNSHVMDGI